MDITIAILGRASTTEPFVELGTQVVKLTGDKILVTPTIPPAAAGKELRVRVSAPNAVSYRTGRFIDPATRPGPTPILNEAGDVVGEEPAPAPVFSGPYAVWGGKVTDGVPFHGSYASVVIGTSGVDLTA